MGRGYIHTHAKTPLSSPACEVFMCVCVSDWCLANLCRRRQLQTCVWMINTAWYTGIIWALKKPLGSRFPSLSLSLFLSLSHFPDQVLKRNIKHFCSTMPPLSSRDCVHAHGVNDPQPSHVLIFPCVSLCLRPPTARPYYVILLLLQPQLTVNSNAARHQSSDGARANNESGGPQHLALVFFYHVSQRTHVNQTVWCLFFFLTVLLRG